MTATSVCLRSRRQSNRKPDRPLLRRFANQHRGSTEGARVQSGGAVEGAPKRSVQGDRLPQAREFEGPPRHVLLLPVGAQEVEVADLDGGGRIQLQELHEGHCVDAAAFGRSLEDKRQGHRLEVLPDVVPEIHVHHGALTHPDKFGHAPIAAASGHIGGACRALSSTLSGSLS